MRAIDVSKLERPTDIIAGPAPMLQWIEIEKLVVDDDYQRELKPGNWLAITRIAAQFKWSRFSPVFVAPIEGGKFAIIDGQHRTHAAAICGFKEVPCQVVRMSREEQAAAFAAVNGLVTRVTVHQIFRAALAAKDTWAVNAAQACADAGCHLSTTHVSSVDKKPGTIESVALIRTLVERGSGPAVTYALRALRQSKIGEKAAVWSGDVLRPLLFAIASRPWVVERNADLVEFLDGFNLWAAIDRAAEISKEKRRQGEAGFSMADVATAAISVALDRAFPQFATRAGGGVTMDEDSDTPWGMA